MKKLQLALLILLLSNSAIFAQTKLIQGQVIDNTTGEALPYATIQIPNTANGTITNEDGFFDLKMDKSQESIEVSYIGYQDKLVEVKKSNKNLIIKLSTFEFKLQEVIVRSKTPLQYIQEAIEKYPDNISRSPFATRGFFMEKSKRVNDNSGAYTKSEAIFNSYLSSYGDTTVSNDNQLVLYRNESKGDFKSMLYENKKIKRKMKKGKLEIDEDNSEEDSEDGMTININDVTGGGPKEVLEIAQSTLSLDFFLPENFKKFEYRFGENTFFKNRELIVIDFISKRKIDNSKYDGSIYLDYEDLAIIAIDFKQNFKIPFYINALLKSVVGFKIDKVNMDVRIKNQLLDGKWYPKELVKLAEITLMQKDQSELISTEQLFNIDQINSKNPSPIAKDLRFDPELPYEEQIFNPLGLKWNEVNVVK